MKQSYLIVFTVLALSVPTLAQEPSYIWWEGENPLETNFPEETYFSSRTFQDKKDLLSEGEWLTNAGEREGDAAFAKYAIDIPESGSYRFWARKFWKHGPFRWRFEDQDWGICSRDVALADEVSIRKHLGANWVYLGEVELSAGKRIFELELLAEEGETLTACFDCFLLTQHPFVPRGKLKPDEKSDKADEGFFAWEPPMDPFSPKALMDLRRLNEDHAGSSGFIRRDGSRFLLGDGTPVRFWGVNASSGIAALDRDSIQYLARKLAKQGVNMVRYHSPLFDPANPDQLNTQKLDNLFFLIHALQQEGIYTTLSFYFPLWFDIKPHYGIEGFETVENKRPFTLLFFEPRMQQIYRAWAKQLFTTTNPYTGKPPAKDPAVAIVEIQNEDSFFFWTFSQKNIPPVHWNRLESLFTDWVMQRYKSVEAVHAAWGQTRLDQDDPAKPHLGLYEAWHMTGDAIRQANAGKQKRTGDQVRFLTELQLTFYTEMKSYFQDELGSRSLISPGNWHVTDPVMLDALERYTYTAGDVIDKHGYFGGPHNSPDGSHSYTVRTGHTFENRSALTVPQALPLQFFQVKDYPQIISEIGWTNPNRYRADYAFLAAAYSALQGVDGIYTFALGGAFWDTGMEKFALSSPVILGNFPAYALLYRRGDVQEADTVIEQRLNIDELFAMKGSGGASAQAFDEFRKADIPPGELLKGEVSDFDPLAFYVGKLERSFNRDTHQSFQMNTEPYIDREREIVRSLTGELAWVYGAGIASIDTPRCKAAAGFLIQTGGGANFDGLTIRCQNEYASIVAIALDDKPLFESETLLIQAMTVERPFGFKASDGKQGTITDLGGYPFGVEKIQASIDIRMDKNARITVFALDENGMKRRKVEPESIKKTVFRLNDTEKAYRIHLDEVSVYHVIQIER